MPKIKSTGCSTKITPGKVAKYLKIWESKTRGQVLAQLLTWYWQRNFLRELAENCFVVFDQSSHRILLTWYCWLYFFPWISCGCLLDGSSKIFDKTIGGEHNSISLHFCKLWQQVPFFSRCWSFRKAFC